MNLLSLSVFISLAILTACGRSSDTQVFSGEDDVAAHLGLVAEAKKEFTKEAFALVAKGDAQARQRLVDASVVLFQWDESESLSTFIGLCTGARFESPSVEIKHPFWAIPKSVKNTSVIGDGKQLWVNYVSTANIVNYTQFMAGLVPRQILSGQSPCLGIGKALHELQMEASDIFLGNLETESSMEISNVAGAQRKVIRAGQLVTSVQGAIKAESVMLVLKMNNKVANPLPPPLIGIHQEEGFDSLKQRIRALYDAAGLKEGIERDHRLEQQLEIKLMPN